MQPSRLAVLIAIGGLLLPTLMTPTPARASRARVRILRDISGPSPFPADKCGLAMPVGGAARGSEYEPDIAVNPAHRRNLIAVYSQDNQMDTVVSTSRDGGRHWTQVPVPGLSQCTPGGTAIDAFDARLAIGPDGIAYTSSSVDEPTGTQTLLVNTSADGGLSWSAPVAVDQNEPSVDGPVLAADPHRPATAYLTWTRALVLLTFSRTTDGGATWTPPAMIPVEPDPMAMTGPGSGKIRVLPDGTLVDCLHPGPRWPRRADRRVGGSFDRPGRQVVGSDPRGGHPGQRREGPGQVLHDNEPSLQHR